jgi:hypothetical protein
LTIPLILFGFHMVLKYATRVAHTSRLLANVGLLTLYLLPPRSQDCRILGDC